MGISKMGKLKLCVSYSLTIHNTDSSQRAQLTPECWFLHRLATIHSYKTGLYSKWITNGKHGGEETRNTSVHRNFHDDKTKLKNGHLYQLSQQTHYIWPKSSRKIVNDGTNLLEMFDKVTTWLSWNSFAIEHLFSELYCWSRLVSYLSDMFQWNCTDRT